MPAQPAQDTHRSADPSPRESADPSPRESASQPEPFSPAGHDRVEVRLPADSAYLAVLRTATAGLAARLDFTLDDIEDLRIAVDEACALLLGQAERGSHLVCTFDLGDDALTVQMTAQTTHARLPEHGTFAWQVLTALAGDVDAGITPGRDGVSRVWIRLHKQREQREQR